jgi:MFS family permease
MTTPLYALLLAYTNDSLDPEDMPAASGGMVLTFGIGAILGPLLTGWAMERWSPYAFWLTLAATFALMAVYAAYRMTRRAPTASEDTESYINVLPTASPLVVEAAGAWSADQTDASEPDSEAQR